MVCTETPTAHLVEHFLSSDVQVPLPTEAVEVKALLSPEQVVKVFTDHVPGVKKFLFRQQPGQCVLKFVQVAYKDGWQAFKGTALHDHLKWLMRLIVHYGHEGKPRAAQYLTEVAEAFMDCQAVQARVVERLGLQIRGVASDFRGLVTALVGDYKSMALKMLAAERIAQGRAHDDATPTHYENRLTADIGEHIGLNADDMRRATLDEHARNRFAKLNPKDASEAAARCRELFDAEAFLGAFVAELNSFGAASLANSLPSLFLGWASENMTKKHAVFDEETCTRVEVDRTLAIAVLEVVFLGKLVASDGKKHREMSLCDLFHQTCSSSGQEADESVLICSPVPEPKVSLQRPLMKMQQSQIEKQFQHTLELYAAIGNILMIPRLICRTFIGCINNFSEIFCPTKCSIMDA